jgi:hypothetical protein
MDIQTIMSQLRDERDRLDQAIRALEGTSPTTRRGRSAKRKRVMSPAARAKIAAAARRRWAAARKAGKTNLAS